MTQGFGSNLGFLLQESIEDCFQRKKIRTPQRIVSIWFPLLKKSTKSSSKNARPSHTNLNHAGRAMSTFLLGKKKPDLPPPPSCPCQTPKNRGPPQKSKPSTLAHPGHQKIRTSFLVSLSNNLNNGALIKTTTTVSIEPAHKTAVFEVQNHCIEWRSLLPYVEGP